MTRFLTSLVLLLPLFAFAVSEQQLAEFSVVPLQIGTQHIQVQLADTDEKRAQGLMFQQTAEPGMFLLYPKPRAISLWMANTALALDVAYIGPDWSIVQLVQLDPYDETPVPSPGAIIAALEMPRGWFAKHGVMLGHKVRFNPNPNP